ncbi:hypothetical protein JTE90_005732 [Oedothorax gibbosus]|uniref:Winged helix Storkhead-box1 domain-containing protein n=1 Tax=Oedothorax gibbosus TaxID=931172 RepID=A0AAV6TZA9_9ARAC|nr:hypothetical protein JTE90_005732 [Oedothorax gibbosus]
MDQYTSDLDPVTMSLVAQTQFAPLPEALCKVVFDLTSEGSVASMQVIGKRLKAAFPELMGPPDDILYKTLGTLIKERKLYHTGSGYSVVTPDTFRLLAMSPPLERQMLLTNDEAIVRLHGTAYAVGDDGRCTQTKDGLTAWSSAERIVEATKQAGKLKRCHSLKLLRSRDKEKLSRSNSFKSTGTGPGTNQDLRSDNENNDTNKKEKSPSMFSKWFRRGRSDKSRKSKGTSSSTQFPPTDWTDPDYALFNSRATQTLEKTEHRTKGRSSSLNRTLSRDRPIHTSTPATPRTSTRNSSRQHNSSEAAYHYRSSSLSRRVSPSPKREVSQMLPTSKVGRPATLPKAQGEEVKMRPRYDSTFSPVTARKKTQSLLMANEKYSNSHNGAPSPLNGNYGNGKVMPYQSTDIINPHISSNPYIFNPKQQKKTEPYLGWRRPTSIVSNLPATSGAFREIPTQPSARIVPRLFLTPQEVSQSKAVFSPQTPTTKTIVSSIKSSETLTKTMPLNGKELRLGTTVDVEISVGNNTCQHPQNKKTLLTTDLDSTVKNDLLKIATTWNQSIKSNSSSKMSDFCPKSNTSIPKLTTTTNITTSFSHRPSKDNPSKMGVAPTECMKVNPVLDRTSLLQCSTGRDSPSKDTLCSGSPRSTMTSDTKSEFFSDSPNTTTEVHISKDDSGFSSSASTSRPMSVSPC